jgi:hypothetical protein
LGAALLIPAAWVLLYQCVALTIFGNDKEYRGLAPWEIAHRAGIPVVNLYDLSRPGIPPAASLTLPLLALAGIGMLVMSTPTPPWEPDGLRSARGIRRTLALTGTISIVGVVLLVSLPLLGAAPPIQSAALLGVLACDALLVGGFWIAALLLRVRARAAGLNWQAATFSAALRALLYLPATLAVAWIFLLVRGRGRAPDEILDYLRPVPLVLAIVHPALLVALIGFVATYNDAARRRRETLAGLLPPTSPPRPIPVHRRPQAVLVILTIASIAIARYGWERHQGPLPVAEDNSRPLMLAAFAPATDRVALTAESSYRDVVLFDTTRWTRIGSFARSSNGYLRQLAFSPDGSALAGIDDDNLFVWDAATGAVRARIPTARGSGGATAIALSPGGRWAAVAYWMAPYGSVNARNVEIFNLSTTTSPTGPPPGTLLARDFVLITCLEFSPDGRWLFSGDETGRVRAWDVAANWRRAVDFKTSSSSILAIAPRPGTRGEVLFVAANVLYHYDFAAGKLIGTFALEGPDPCSAIAVSPDGRRVVTVDGAIHVRNLADASIIATFRRQTRAYRAAFSADGKRVFTADIDGHLRAWELPPEARPRR